MDRLPVQRADTFAGSWIAVRNKYALRLTALPCLPIRRRLGGMGSRAFVLLRQVDFQQAAAGSRQFVRPKAQQGVAATVPPAQLARHDGQVIAIHVATGDGVTDHVRQAVEAKQPGKRGRSEACDFGKNRREA